MGCIIIKSGNDIEIVDEVDFSSDKNESYLHELIEKNPNIIPREITGCDIVVLASRFRLPSGGELDLLLIDCKGNLYIVELKRGKGVREAIAQLIDYASEVQRMSIDEFFDNIKSTKFRSLNDIYKHFHRDFDGNLDDFKKNFLGSLRNPRKIRLILISYSIGEDTLRIVEWLRQVGINIFCIEFDYFRSEDKEIFVPKLLRISGLTRVKVKTLTEVQKKYKKFFSKVLSKFKADMPGVVEKEPLPNHWLSIPTGFGSIHFEWLFRGHEPNKILEVALHFESNDENFNQRLLDHFKSKEEILRKEIASSLKFGNFGRRWRKIYVERIVGTLDMALNDDVVNWAVEMMKKFYIFFKEKGELENAINAIKG